MSDTAAAIFWKIGAQVGLVTWQTRMSPLLQPRDLLDRLHDAGRPFDHAAGGGEAAISLLSASLAGRQPGIQALPGDAPEHDDGRIVDDIRHRAQRRRRIVLGPFRDARRGARPRSSASEPGRAAASHSTRRS